MTFIETFWATMWGALAGGAFSAFVAWLFALELRRREKRARDDERAVQQGAMMRREWADIADLTSLYSAWLKMSPPRWRVRAEQHNRAVRRDEQRLHDRIVRAGALASGEDAQLIQAIGTASMASSIQPAARIAMLDEITQHMLTLAVSDPERLPQRRSEALAFIRQAVDAER